MNDDGYNSPRREGFFLTEEADRIGMRTHQPRAQSNSSSDESSDSEVDSRSNFTQTHLRFSASENVDHQQVSSESKLNAMRKHNAFRLRQQQIKMKLADDASSPQPSSLRNLLDRAADVDLNRNQDAEVSDGHFLSGFDTSIEVDKRDDVLSARENTLVPKQEIEENNYNENYDSISKVSTYQSSSYKKNYDNSNNDNNFSENENENENGNEDENEDEDENDNENSSNRVDLVNEPLNQQFLKTPISSNLTQDTAISFNYLTQERAANFHHLTLNLVRPQHSAYLETIHEVKNEVTVSDKRQRQKELGEKFCGEEMIEYIRCIPNVKKTQESWIKAKKEHAIEAERQYALQAYRGSKIIAEKEAKIILMQESITKLLLSKTPAIKKTPRKRPENVLRINSDAIDDHVFTNGEDGFSRSKSAGQDGESKMKKKDHGIRSPGSEVVYRRDQKGSGTNPKSRGVGIGVGGRDLDPLYRPSWISNQDARYDERGSTYDERGSTYEEYGEEKGDKDKRGDGERDLRSQRARGRGVNGGRSRGGQSSSSVSVSDVAAERIMDQRFDLGCGEEWFAAVVAQRKIQSDKIKEADLEREKEKEKEREKDRKNNTLIFDDKNHPSREIGMENKEEKEKIKSKRNPKILKDDKIEGKNIKEKIVLDCGKLGKNVLMNLGLEVENKILAPKKMMKKKKRRVRKDLSGGVEDGGGGGVGDLVDLSSVNIGDENFIYDDNGGNNLISNILSNNNVINFIANNNNINNNDNSNKNNDNINIGNSSLAPTSVSYKDFLSNVSRKELNQINTRNNGTLTDFKKEINTGSVHNTDIKLNPYNESTQSNYEKLNYDNNVPSNNNNYNQNINTNFNNESNYDINTNYINANNYNYHTHDSPPSPSFSSSTNGDISLTQVLADLDRTRELTRRGVTLTSSLTLSSAASSSLSYTPTTLPHSSSSSSSSSSSYQPSSTSSPAYTSSIISSYPSPTSSSSSAPFSFDPMSSTSEKGRFKVQDPRNFDAESIRCSSDPQTPSVTLVMGRRRVRARYPVTDDVINESSGKSSELVAVLFERRWFSEDQARAWWGENGSRVHEEIA